MRCSLVDPNPSDPRIGLDFGDYIVTKKISQGGMGAVYLAVHPSGMKKAVKFMLDEALKTPAIRKRFENECYAAKRLKGRSGIVEIDSFGERNGELYLVMEYIEGTTLEDHIARNVRLTPHHTFHVAVLMLRALSVLHKEGIIHRDLKPSNVFLRDTDERPYDPTLIDFGIVHDNHAMTTGTFSTRDGQMIGTVGFMATEQYGQANKVTPATDVFACAVIIWQMLTGELPWGYGETPYDQYNRQLNYKPVWPAHIPLPYAEGLKEVLISALSADPTQRPATAQLFALMLAQRLEPDPPHVPSGLDMVSKLAPRFLQDLPPELETVRQPNGRIEVAVFWPPRASNPSITPSQLNLDAIRVSAIAPAPAHPPSSPTVNARGHAPSARSISSESVSSAPSASGSSVPLMGTLSAATGSTFPPPHVAARATKRVWLWGIAALLAAGGLLTFGIAMGLSSKNRRTEGATQMRPASDSTVLTTTASDAGVPIDNADAGVSTTAITVDAAVHVDVQTNAPVANAQPPAQKIEAVSPAAIKKPTRVRATTNNASRGPEKTSTDDTKTSVKNDAGSASPSAGSAASAKKPYDPDAPKR